MRVLIGLAAVIVFGAMFVLDTAALVRVTVSCAVGGCGVGLIWIAIGFGGLVLIGMLLSKRPRTKASVTRVTKTRPSRPSRGGVGAARKSKQRKQLS